MLRTCHAAASSRAAAEELGVALRCSQRGAGERSAQGRARRVRERERDLWVVCVTMVQLSISAKSRSNLWLSWIL